MKQEESMLHVGDRAPDFSATTDAGTTLSLSDFRGKKLVLYFYPKDDTSGCTKEACSFRDHHQVLLDHGAVVLGVSTDSVESHANFKQKHQLPFPLISDESHDVVEAYGVWQEKNLYGRTYMGTVRTTYVIDERGVITHIFPKVTVDGHVEEVLAALTGEPLPLRLSSEPRTAPESTAPAEPAKPAMPPVPAAVPAPAMPVPVSAPPVPAPATPAQPVLPPEVTVPVTPAPAVKAAGRTRAPKRRAPTRGAKTPVRTLRAKSRGMKARGRTAARTKAPVAKSRSANMKKKTRPAVRAVPRIVRRTTRTAARKARGVGGRKGGRRR
jgi:peroxiredoxin Q/BCP